MMVAKLNSHSFTEYPTDGSKLYPHCTITTCVNIHFTMNPHDTLRTAARIDRPKDTSELSITGHYQKRQHVFETE